MKKLVLSLAVIAALIVGVATYTSASPAIVTTTPALATPPPGPPNPYCNNSNVIACPTVTCPEDFAPDTACVSACYSSYVNAVRAAWDRACARYDAANDEWVSSVESAVATYNQCVIDTGGVMSPAACEAALFEALSATTGELGVSRERIAATLQSDLAVILGVAIACMQSCCVIEEE